MRGPRPAQFTGCLIGQCVGDALGFPVEGEPPAVCRQYVTETLKPGQTRARGRGPFAFGQYTDDSQLARELLQSYAACRRFDPEDYASRISAIFREGRIVGPGRATEAAAQRLATGVPWQEAGTPPPAAGNGSAMRAGPIGLLYFDAPEQLIQSAHDQSRITHQDRRCSAGAVAIAGAVALALEGAPIEPTPFLSQLSVWARAIEPSVSVGLHDLITWSAWPPDDAVRAIATAGLSTSSPPPEAEGQAWEGISPFVTSSVLWSLYAFLRTPGDYWETICTAIAVGGDVDTTAAMAGAISGAHLGLEAIPSQCAHGLTDQGTWGYAELVELAQRCYDVKMERSR